MSPNSVPTNDDTAELIKAKRGKIALQSIIMGGFVFLLVIAVASLGYLVTVAGRIDQVQTRVSESADRQREQTNDAVNQIIDQLNTLETNRTITTANLVESQRGIRQALRVLCSAQGITCPTLTP